MTNYEIKRDHTRRSLSNPTANRIAPVRSLPWYSPEAGTARRADPDRYPGTEAAAAPQAAAQGDPADARGSARTAAAEGRRRPKAAPEAGQATQARDLRKVNGKRTSSIN